MPCFSQIYLFTTPPVQIAVIVACLYFLFVTVCAQISQLHLLQNNNSSHMWLAGYGEFLCTFMLQVKYPNVCRVGKQVMPKNMGKRERGRKRRKRREERGERGWKRKKRKERVHYS